MDMKADPNVPNWDRYFVEMAKLVSTKSKDPSTKVGAVIVSSTNEVLSTGFNGFCRGIDEHAPGRWERPDKYSWVAHAEANAIYNAARNGIRVAGARMYLNWAPTPCIECTKAIIQAGIIGVLGPDIPFAGKGKQWEEHFKLTKIMLREAGVDTFYVGR
jgi:dCMP deaminase